MMRMNAKDALVAVHSARGPRDVVITTMTPARDWMAMAQSPLDHVFVPSAMGHATSVGLGIALAQPTRRVIVCNGDGSMLMNLGSLVSIAAADVRNLVVIVFANGTYEVTGAQPVPGGGGTDFATIARGAGFRAVHAFERLEDWTHECAEILNTDGPAFVLLHVEQVIGQPGPRSPGPAAVRARRLMEALQR
jgi:phosphonopyruvate decarboxylase